MSDSKTEAAADVMRIKAWQNFAVVLAAVIGSLVLTGLQILPVEITGNVISTCVMALVLSKQNGS